MLDNFLECYHCQMAHPEFNEMMSIGDSKFTMFKNFTYQNAPTKGKRGQQSLSPGTGI